MALSVCPGVVAALPAISLSVCCCVRCKASKAMICCRLQCVSEPRSALDGSAHIFVTDAIARFVSLDAALADGWCMQFHELKRFTTLVFRG
jgi:uncharacterized protein (DUF924 family)